MVFGIGTLFFTYWDFKFFIIDYNIGIGLNKFKLFIT